MYQTGDDSVIPGLILLLSTLNILNYNINMYFQVPQFIEIEDKIFGPFTFKQFLYILGGASIAFVCFKLLPAFIAFFVCAPFVAFALALAFYKVNNRPFIAIVQSWLAYKSGTKLYTWKVRKSEAKNDTLKTVTKKTEESGVPKLSQSKLREMSWSLDILDTNKRD
jgi:hypothetical protein